MNKVIEHSSVTSHMDSGSAASLPNACICRNGARDEFKWL